MMARMLSQLPLPLLPAGAAEIAPGVGMLAGDGSGLVTVHGLARASAGLPLPSRPGQRRPHAPIPPEPPPRAGKPTVRKTPGENGH